MGPRYGRQLAKIGVVIEHQLVPKSEAVLSPDRSVRVEISSVFSSALLARHAGPRLPRARLQAGANTTLSGTKLEVQSRASTSVGFADPEAHLRLNFLCVQPDERFEARGRCTSAAA